MKKIVFLVLGLMATVCQAEVITITTEAQLRDLASSKSTYAGDVIRLANDIVLSNGTGQEPVYWTPIGTPEKHFQGTFDGQGHNITGIKIDYDSQIEYTGLFGYIGSSGKVCNVRINMPTDEDYEDDTNFIIFSAGKNGQSCYVGGIAGWNEGTISQCVVATHVSAIHVNAFGGGIAGYNNGIIENCYVVSNIYATQEEPTIRLGGIVGDNDGTLINSWTKAAVQNISMTGRDNVCGTNDGTVSGCFYANGSSANVSLSNKGYNSSILSSLFSTENGAINKSVLLDSRTLYTDDSWNTLCLPFSIAASSEGLSPIAGATVMEMTSASLTTNLLSIHFEPATQIVAGKPYLIKWSDTSIGDITNPVFLGTTIVEDPDTTVTYDDGKVSFIGTFSGVQVTANDKSLRFLSANDSLYYPNQNMILGSCRAYFKFKQAVEARQVILSFDDMENTSLTTVKLGRIDDSNDWFNLNGQRLTEKPTTGGIYLHHGKKIIVK